jgi:hypothetical protein
MATKVSKKEYLCLIRDYPNMLQKRLEIRQEHLAKVSENSAVKVGGTIPIPPAIYMETLGLIYRRDLYEGAFRR